MRHKKSFNHLGRKSAHRKAMLSNMGSSLIKHKRIETTTAKAKALKRYIEPLITRSKDDSTHSRRVVFRYLQDKDAVTELFREVGTKVADRPGGYTRIIKLGKRQGDNADMCLIELVDYNENMLTDKAESKKSTSRRRRGSKPKVAAIDAAATDVVEEPAAEAVVEEPVAEEPVADEVVEEVVEEEVVEEPVAEVETPSDEVKATEEQEPQPQPKEQNSEANKDLSSEANNDLSGETNNAASEEQTENSEEEEKKDS